VTWNQAAHRINPEKLFFKGDFVDPCHVGQGKSSPAQPEGTGTTLAGFINELGEFFPVGHLFKRQVLDGSTGDDQAIQRPLGSGFIPRDIELLEVLLVPAFISMGVQANPDRFDLEYR
jgi:hypothetical protein